MEVSIGPAATRPADRPAGERAAEQQVAGSADEPSRPIEPLGDDSAERLFGRPTDPPTRRPADPPTNHLLDQTHPSGRPLFGRQPVADEAIDCAAVSLIKTHLIGSLEPKLAPRLMGSGLNPLAGFNQQVAGRERGERLAGRSAT